MFANIQTIEKSLYSGPALLVIMPTDSGIISVLPGHAPLITSLKTGEIIVKTERGEQKFPASGGFAEIKGDSINILAK